LSKVVDLGVSLHVPLPLLSVKIFEINCEF
jgi:hypothetical protein